MLCGVGLLRRKRSTDSPDEESRPKDKQFKGNKKRKRSQTIRDEELLAQSEVEKCQLEAENERLLQDCQYLNSKVYNVVSRLTEVEAENQSLKWQHRELQESNIVTTKLLDELQMKYEQSLVKVETLAKQIQLLAKSETSLQIKLAAQIKTTEDFRRDKLDSKETVKMLQESAMSAVSMKKVIEAQERHLLEKTQRILTLETALKTVSEQIRFVAYVEAKLISISKCDLHPIIYVRT